MPMMSDDELDITARVPVSSAVTQTAGLRGLPNTIGFTISNDG